MEPRPHSEAAFIVLYASALLTIYYWRYGTLIQSAIALVTFISACPDRIPCRLYKAMLDWPYIPVTDYKRPPHWLILLLSEPWTWIFPIKAKGFENVPRDTTRILFVGNHQLYGLDIPLTFSQIYKETGLYPRGLGDRSLFIVPGWKQFLEALGGVIGTREICGALMEKGEPLLVFPGGADEVLKTEKDAKNVLKWKQRTGFAHMAAQHKYLIVPFATIGIEDAFSIWFSLSATWFYALIGDMRSSKNVKVPIIKPFFKPQAVYMWFGEPVDTSNYNIADSQSIFELRETVRLQVQRGLSDCLDRQKKDTNRYHNVFKTARMRLMSSISNEKRAL